MSMLVFMPWCRLDKSYEAGGVTILPFNIGKQIDGATDIAWSSIRTIMSTYKTIEGNPVDRAAIVRYKEKLLLDDLTADEIALVYDIGTLFCFCGLAHRHYFNAIGNYCNSDHFVLFIQKFTNTDFTALRTRRREGHTWSAWPIKDISITIPSHCHTVREVRINEMLLAALADFRTRATDRDWARWQNALSCFNQANSDNDTVRHQVEWVLLSSAFEHLLGANPNAKDVASKFSDSFAASVSLKVDSARPRATGRSKRDAPLCYEWMREFYSIRGDFAHGKLITRRSTVWNELEHLVLAAIAFPLLIKCFLTNSGVYNLTDSDQAQLDAFEEFADTPNFMMPPSDQKGSLDSHWSRIYDRHKSNAGIAQAVNKAWREVTAADENCDAKPDNETGAGGAV